MVILGLRPSGDAYGRDLGWWTLATRSSGLHPVLEATIQILEIYGSVSEAIYLIFGVYAKIYQVAAENLLAFLLIYLGLAWHYVLNYLTVAWNFLLIYNLILFAKDEVEMSNPPTGLGTIPPRISDGHTSRLAAG